ncbi:MAG: glycosyltransferase [Candidatus Acidiferrales bacterium]
MSGSPPKSGPILCLCQEDNHRKIIPSYANAFRSLGVPFVPVDWSPPFNASIDDLLSHCSERPAWIFHFESDFPLFPDGLEKCEVPTVSFHIDTYVAPRRRMQWASLFDHVAVFHPRYDAMFRKRGHPGAFLHPHAVRRDFFERTEVPREFEVGWVGQVEGAIYRKREQWIPKLSAAFRMNDWRRPYSLAEVADVYRRSRIVVNFGRDDFPQDANMRVFEVLASGALLVTSLPSEMTELGFVDGVHFIGYGNEREIIPIVRRFLDDEAARSGIAIAARTKVLADHTYEARARQTLERLREAGDRKLAPARTWPASNAGLLYVDYFAAHGRSDLAGLEYRRIAGRGIRATVEGAALLVKSQLSESLTRWKSRRARA